MTDAEIEKLKRQNKALTKLANTLLDFLLNDYELTQDNSTVGVDSFCMINGKAFRCECGCNVFRALQRDTTKYKCNACEEIYQSE
jgi:hypothetical protein